MGLKPYFCGFAKFSASFAKLDLRPKFGYLRPLPHPKILNTPFAANFHQSLERLRHHGRSKTPQLSFLQTLIGLKSTVGAIYHGIMTSVNTKKYPKEFRGILGLLYIGGMPLIFA